MAQRDLEQRVTRAAEAVLAEQRYVSAIDVLQALGWLAPSHVDQWRQARVDCDLVRGGLGVVVGDGVVAERARTTRR